MAKDSDKATFAIGLEGNLPEAANRAADSMQALRDRIAQSTGSLRELGAMQRNLKGSSEELKAARDELGARIKAERQSVAAASLELLKAQKATGALGKSELQLAAAKAATKAKTDAMSSAITTAGGPVAGLRDRVKALSGVLGEGGSAAGLLTFAIAGTVAAIAAMGLVVGGALAALGRFVTTSRDAARSAALLREAAWGGNAKWGAQAGEQIAALSRNVPTARADIEKLGLSLAKQNIGGQAWADSLNAITQASAALGDEAGRKIQSFIERAMVLGRPGLFRISPQELIGTGVSFKHVAESLAKNMHVGVAEAQRALYSGRVKMADGAKALRDAVEGQLGRLNLRQMLSLDVMAKKLGETFDDLTSGVDIEPLVKGFRELLSVFDLSTVTGQALKQIVTVFGGDMVKAMSDATPLAKQFIYGLIIGAQRITIQYLRVRNAIRDALGPDMIKRWNLLDVALQTPRISLEAIRIAVEAMPGPFKAIGDVVRAASDLLGLIKAPDTKPVGKAIVDGVAAGILAQTPALKVAVAGVGEEVKGSFRDKLQIHSPSAVFAQYGEHTAAGYEQGLERGTGGARRAVSAMVQAPRAGGAASGGTGGGVNVNVTIHATGGSAREVAEAVSSPGVVEQLTKAVLDALTGAGVPVPA